MIPVALLLALVLDAAAPAAPAPAPEPVSAPASAPSPAAVPALTTLHGFTVSNLGGSDVRTEFWAARGHRVRTEALIGDVRLVGVQVGDVRKVWTIGDPLGASEQLAGLFAWGLLETLERVRAEGRFLHGAAPLGIPCEAWELEMKVDKKQEQAVAICFAKETGLPVKTETRYRDHQQVTTVLEMYEQLEPNVEIPDSLFTVPADITFLD